MDNTHVWMDGMFKIPNKNPKQIQNSRTKKKNFWGQEIPLKSCGYLNAGVLDGLCMNRRFSNKNPWNIFPKT